MPNSRTLSCADFCGVGAVAWPFSTSAALTCQLDATARPLAPDFEAVAVAVQPPLTVAWAEKGAARRPSGTTSATPERRTTRIQASGRSVFIRSFILWTQNAWIRATNRSRGLEVLRNVDSGKAGRGPVSLRIIASRQTRCGQ